MRILELESFDYFEPIRFPETIVLTDRYNLTYIKQQRHSRNIELRVNKSVDRARQVLNQQDNLFLKRSITKYRPSYFQ